ncbi:MAG: pyruvate formate lyase family protein [Clostridiaceae bacterium]
MSQITFLNEFEPNRTFSFDERIALLRKRKVAQTEEKARSGGADEDDYGLIEQDAFCYTLKPNHPNGSIYGYAAWTENYTSVLREHPIYCDPLDAFAAKGFLFLERLRPKDKKWNPYYAYPELQTIFDRYNITSGIDNCHHFTPDLEIGLSLGWGGILEQLKAQKPLHDATHAAFYDSEIAVVEAVIAFVLRAADEIEAMAQTEQNRQLAENLHAIAEIDRKIAAGKPETFREALQWSCWFSMLSRTYNRGSAGGQLEDMFNRFYEADVAAGRLTDDEAVFYLACMFLQDSRYFQLSGPDPVDGHDKTCRLSYLALEAADKINLACNLTVRVHDGIDPDFYRTSVEYLFKNKQGWPRYSSDSALVKGFMRCGYPLELARRRVAAGCHWMCIPGMEYTMNDTVKINLAKVFEVAFFDMMDDQTEALSAERLFRSFQKHLKIAVDATGAGIMHHLAHQTESQPELILNLFQHGLIEKGLNITDGGANYYNMCVDGSGLAVVADSFAACEQRIDLEHRLDYAALRRHLEENFSGPDGEYVRQMLDKSPRYGGGDTLGDRWAVRVSKLYAALVRDLVGQYREKNVNFIPGFFSWSNTILFGKALGATPNGRKAFEPINHGANPNGGFRKDGAVTAMCNAIAAIQPNFGNTAPVQLELDPGIANDPEGVDKMAAMIKAILESGNTLLNINIIDARKILEAHKDPYKYPDLVVRVTGFTAFFAMLSEPFRELVVERVRAVNPEADQQTDLPAACE